MTTIQEGVGDNESLWVGENYGQIWASERSLWSKSRRWFGIDKNRGEETGCEAAAIIRGERGCWRRGRGGRDGVKGQYIDGMFVGGKRAVMPTCLRQLLRVMPVLVLMSSRSFLVPLDSFLPRTSRTKASSKA